MRYLARYFGISYSTGHNFFATDENKWLVSYKNSIYRVALLSTSKGASFRALLLLQTRFLELARDKCDQAYGSDLCEYTAHTYARIYAK